MHCNHFFFLSLLCGTVADTNFVPVFLMDNEYLIPNTPVNPFKALTPLEFMEILHLVKKRSSSVIIFVEHEFCTEDISGKDKIGSPFYHLRQGLNEHKVKYFPSVLNPYELLNQLFLQHDYNRFYLKHETTKLPIYDNRYKYFYVFFQDAANETRVEALRRHDSIMKEVFLVIKQFHTGPVLTFYTGRTNPMSWNRREPVPLTKPKLDIKKFVNKYTILKLGGVSLLRNSKRWLLTSKITPAEEVYIINDDPASKKVQFTANVTNFQLVFNFTINDKRWTLDTIAWMESEEVVGNKKLDLSAPWNVSFTCNEPIYIDNTRDKSIVTINNYQLEVVKEWLGGNVSDKRNKFLRSVDCQPYFNSTIVTCLFVTFLCLIILAYGVVMLMDCESNDRYDDPQGKPLTITEN